MKRTIGFMTLVCCAVMLQAAEPVRFLSATPESVLFIGNSFTGGTLNIYAHVHTMALLADDPDTIVTGAYLDGGKSLSYHWNLGEAQKKIRVGGWDVVVLQEFTDYAAGPDTMLHYVGLFKALIDSIGARTVLYMTHDNQLHDIEDVQAVTDSVGNYYNVPVVPCGLTHEIVKAEHPYLDPLLDPFDTDRVHPGSVGRYLNICTFYSALTRKSPVGIDFNPGLYPTYNDSDLLYIQSATWDLMRDYIKGPCTDSSSAPTVPPGLTGDPQSLSSVTLHWDESSHAACGVRKYHIYRDGAYAGSAYQPAFKDTNLLGGTAYDYTVSAVSLGGVESAQSSPVTVTTIADTILPELVEVPVTKRATQVELIFSETLDSASASTPGNYTVDHGITVSAAKLTGTRVSLTVSALSESVTYTVTVTGVMDNSTSKNVIAAGTQGTFKYIAPTMMENCIGYYPFEMSLEDYSSTGLTATWKREPSFTLAGYDGYGVELIGTEENSFPIIPRHTVNRNLEAFTVALWMKKAVASEDGWLFYQQSGFDLRVQAANFTGNVFTDSVSATFNYSTSLVNNTEWHHIALTYDGARVRLYVDATEVGRDTAIGTKTAYASIAIGNHPNVSGGVRSFYGTIDELRMYNAALDSVAVAALFADNAGLVAAADSVAVQELINQNMLITSVGKVTEKDPGSGRVTVCDFDSMGLYRIVGEVGQLTALRAFYCAGDAAADSLLTVIDPAIGMCTALETLVLKDNILTSLPDEIAGLTNLKYLDVSGNMLCGVSGAVETWLDTYDPDWASTQTGCTGVVLPRPETRSVIRLDNGVLLDARGRMVSESSAASGMYLRYDTERGRMIKVLIVK